MVPRHGSAQSAIIDTYKDKVLKCPKIPEEWRTVSQGFAQKWDYHNCGGALDVPMKKPKRERSLYYNYKNFHRNIPMAVADANYKLLYVDIGYT